MVALLILAFLAAGPHPKPPFLIEVKLVNVQNIKPVLRVLYIVAERHVREKLAVVCADGKMLVMGSDETAQVGLTVNDVKRALQFNGENFKTARFIIHNHDHGESPSPTDRAAALIFRASGFRGQSLICDVQTGRLYAMR
jgi:hypothetical protein